MGARRVLSKWFQSTRPRGARPRVSSGGGPTHPVSIHAPARGATRDPPQDRRRREFQSTRPRGARHQGDSFYMPSAQFQSTRPRGARRLAHLFAGLHPGVSIHAPARGATDKKGRGTKEISFNPRARAGRDPSIRHHPLTPPTFQSTRPRGARLVLPPKSVGCSRFNPRARAGRDWLVMSGADLTTGFNPRARAGRDIRRKI